LRAARKFIVAHILTMLSQVLENRLFQDDKSKFQEIAQEKIGITPTYAVLKEWGPDHDKHFKIGVYLDKEFVAEGEGSSKQEAEQDAAHHALRIKHWKQKIIN
jgi:ribonuclease-3